MVESAASLLLGWEATLLAMNTNSCNSQYLVIQFSIKAYGMRTAWRAQNTHFIMLVTKAKATRGLVTVIGLDFGSIGLTEGSASMAASTFRSIVQLMASADGA